MYLLIHSCAKSSIFCELSRQPVRFAKSELCMLSACNALCYKQGIVDGTAMMWYI